MTIAASGKKPAFVGGRQGTRYCYWLAGSAILGAVLDGADGTIIPTFTAVAGGVDDDAIAADEFMTSNGVHHIGLMYRSGGAIVKLNSTDGVVFS